MTPKEKAKQLIDKFTLPFSPNIEEAKQCALIAVDEILDKDGYNNDYWKEIKQEIHQL